MMGDGGREAAVEGEPCDCTAAALLLWHRVIAPLLHCTGALRLQHCAARASSQVLTQAQRPPPGGSAVRT